MKSGKFKKITDDMIGMDDKLCSCASEEVDILISRAENEKGKISQRKKWL
jgi:hypothetical protein